MSSTPRKKNAASQFRSRRSKRISHPLLDDGDGEPSPSTPPRENGGPRPVTPEHPSLLNALEMAARPSPTKGDGGKDARSNVVASSLPSYASSIEAMAALVESSHSAKKRSPRSSPRKSPRKVPSSSSLSSSSSRSPTKLRKGGSNGSSGSARSKTQGSRRASDRKVQSNRVWMIAVPVLLSFVMCECFLWLLVFRFNDGAAASRGATLPLSVNDIVRRIMKRDFDEKEREGTVDLLPDELSSSVADGADPHEQEETAAESKGDLARLQSMLERGFAMLRGLSVDYDQGLSRERVEFLCGNVWTVANERLLSADDNSVVEPTGSSEMTLEEMSQLDTSPWKSLALGAQHCLGGAGLAFLTTDVDASRLRVSTKVFDRLMYVEPYDRDIRAGLGTSLLVQGIFYRDDKTEKEANDDTQQQLLTLATYHLKVASTLGSTQLTDVGAEDNDAGVNRLSGGTVSGVEQHLSSTHAAILHNLALSYIALGDNQKSVPVLLRAAALRRAEGSEVKTYWNAPSEVLQLAEEKALLLAAKSEMPAKPKKKGLPFFR